jgi:hypothetical protein
VTAPIAFVDTETDGVHRDRKAWEIAIIRREPNGDETEWQAFIDIDLATADPFGLRVGGFYDRHPLGQFLAGSRDAYPVTGPRMTGPGADSHLQPDLMPIQYAALTIARMTHGAHIVGAVPNFDTEVLAQLLRTQGLNPAWHYHLVDVENLAVGFLAGNGNVFTPPWKSDLLNEAIGLEPVDEADRHTALGDARWAAAIYDTVMGNA